MASKAAALQKARRPARAIFVLPAEGLMLDSWIRRLLNDGATPYSHDTPSNYRLKGDAGAVDGARVTTAH